MKKKLLLLILGVLIGILTLTQFVDFEKIKKTEQLSTAPTEIKSIKKNSLVLKTVAYQVLSFVKHQ